MALPGATIVTPSHHVVLSPIHLYRLTDMLMGERQNGLITTEVLKGRRCYHARALPDGKPAFDHPLTNADRWCI